MDPHYFFSIVSFLVGLLAGFQGIYERYQKDSGTALRTLPGIVYLATRGAVPAIIFIVLYGRHYLMESELFLQAAACGTGAELVLRMRFYVKSRTVAGERGESIEELLKGPFDLLRWYQGLFLEAIARYLAESRKKIVRECVPKDVDFLIVIDRVINNLGAWPSTQTSDDLQPVLNKLKTEFQGEVKISGDTSPLQQKYKDKLGYFMLNKVGPGGLKTLLSS